MAEKLNVSILSAEYAILRFPADANIYPLLSVDAKAKGNAEFFSITKTADEISIVTDPNHPLVIASEKQEGHFRAFKIEGPLDFALTGILANFTDILAKAGISVFAISTFDTDYILVPAEKAGAAKVALMNDYNVTG